MRSLFKFILPWLLHLLSIRTLAQGNTCWRSEINYLTQKKYASASLYQQHVDSWGQQAPEQPSWLLLNQAFEVYQQELSYSKKFKRDKVKHCFMGCRIAKETNFSTAKYTAWYKEQKDLIDCKLSSLFEIVDYDSTLDGAKNPGLRKACEKYCVKEW